MEILSIILNALLGSGLIVTLLNLRSARRKAKNENYKSEIDLVTTSVETMIEAQKKLMAHNQELIVALTDSRRENAQLASKIDELEKKISDMICTNKEIVKILRKMKIDDAIINRLNDTQN